MLSKNPRFGMMTATEPASAALGLRALDLGDLHEARRMFRAALKQENNVAIHHFRLGLVEDALGHFPQAAEYFTAALRFDPQMTDAARRLSDILSRGILPDGTRFDHAGLRAAMALRTADRDLIAAASLHHLSRSAPLNDILKRGRKKGYAVVARDLCLERTAEILKSPLLLAVLHAGVIANRDMEVLLTALRRVILLELPSSRLQDADLTTFISALVRQCWLNEFVWEESEEETRKLAETAIDPGLLLQGDETSGSMFLLRCLYRPPCAVLDSLHSKSPKDIARMQPSALRTALAEWIDERNLIETKAAALARFGAVSDETSLKVASQYEASPYPRWTSVALFRPGYYLKHLAAHFDTDRLRFTDRPFEVLIAGCGTGRQAVSAAFDYGSNARVLGIDISEASLGYAAMMAERMKAPNLSFARGDIRAIEAFQPTFAKRFAVIECTGVLHHMADPFGAWRRLINCLAPKGIMLIGLYSRTARRNLPLLRGEPAYPGAACTEAELRAYRSYLKARPGDAPGRELMRGRDFYSASGFRDYFLHISEKTTTLPEIRDFLAATGLTFRGFAGVPFEALKAQFPSEKSPGSLDRWAELEERHPDMFGAMYQFWCTLD